MRPVVSSLLFLAACGSPPEAATVEPASAAPSPVAPSPVAPAPAEAVVMPAPAKAGPDGLTNGDILADFTLARVQGEGTWRLYDHVAPDGTGSHQAALIAFTASWCGPCRASLPTLAELENEHPDLAIVVLSIDDKETERQIEQKAMDAAGLKAPLLVADQDTQQAILGDSRRIPRFLFLNKVAELMVQDRGFGDKVRPMMPKQANYALSHPTYSPR